MLVWVFCYVCMVLLGHGYLGHCGSPYKKDVWMSKGFLSEIFWELFESACGGLSLSSSASLRSVAA